MTTEEILDDLYAITYSDTSYSIARRFQAHDEDFEDFESFPLIVVTTGPEDIEAKANLFTTSIFQPEIHFFYEDQTAETMETWRDDIRNAIYEDSSLRGDAISVNITSIVPSESEDRKLQHLIFYLEIEFDIEHT